MKAGPFHLVLPHHSLLCPAFEKEIVIHLRAGEGGENTPRIKSSNLRSRPVDLIVRSTIIACYHGGFSVGFGFDDNGIGKCDGLSSGSPAFRFLRRGGDLLGVCVIGVGTVFTSSLISVNFLVGEIAISPRQ